MPNFSGWLSRLRALFKSRRLDEEFDQEIASHLASLKEENIRRGMSPVDAHHAALCSFGGVTQVKESNRQERSLALIESIVQDVCYAGRILRKNPGFTMAVMITLGLGIGITTILFAVVDSVLLHPLQFPHSERIVRVWQALQSGKMEDQTGFSASELADYRQSSKAFEAVSGFQEVGFTLSEGDHASLLWGARIDPDIFRVLGISPIIGREFLAEESQSGHRNVVILGYQFWQEHFAGRTDAMGKEIILNGKPYTVVGVMPPEFYAVEGMHEDYYVDAVLTPLIFAQDELGHRDDREFDAIARLKPGIRMEAARAESLVLANQLHRPDDGGTKDSEKWRLIVQTAKDYLTGDIKAGVFLLCAAAGIVLLIACSNVAGLLLGRILNRRSEFAIRVALGASRGRLLRLVMAETTILAILGGCLGLGLSSLALRLCRVFSLLTGRGIGYLLKRSEVDWSSLGFVLCATVFTALATSMASSWRISGRSFLSSLSLAESRQTASPDRAGAQKLLLVAQISMALVLVSAAGMTMSSFVHLLHTNLGFDPNHVLMTWVSVPDSRYSTADKQINFFSQVLERIRSLPGVEAAGTIDYPLYWGLGPHVCFTVEKPWTMDGCSEARLRIVSPDFFATVRIPLRSGRVFTTQDRAGGAPVFIVNETLARKYFHVQPPIGSQLSLDRSVAEKSGTVIGIVGDTRYDPISDKPVPEIYMPFAQSPATSGNLWVRATGSPQSIIAAVERQVWAVDKDQPVYVQPGVATVADSVKRGQSYQRLLTALFIAFAGLALFMASIGIYAITHFFVAQRKAEFSIRMALGSQPRGILRLAMGYGLRLAATGVAIGLAVMFWLRPLLQSVVYHAEPTDFWVTIAVICFLCGITVLACYIPARRAMTADPLSVLRDS